MQQNFSLKISKNIEIYNFGIDVAQKSYYAIFLISKNKIALMFEKILLLF